MALLLVCFALLATSVSACSYDYDELMESIPNEQLIWQGINQYDDISQIFVDPNTGAWTLVIITPEGSCFLQFGEWSESFAPGEDT